MKEVSLALETLFVNRRDSSAVQRSDGQYFRVAKPLTLEVLEQHLEGEITVGAHQLPMDNTVKYLCFNLDPEKLTDPMETAKTIIRECIDKPDPEKPRFYTKAVNQFLAEASE